MERTEAITAALGKIDWDEIAAAILMFGKIVDKLVTVGTFVAAATRNQEDDKVVATLALFDQALSPALERTADFLASLDDAEDEK